MRSARTGWRRLAIALVAALAGALVAVPAVAGAATPAPIVTVSPTEGELVDADPVLRWTSSGTSGYEVRWNATGELDDTGALDVASDGDRAFTGDESHQLAGLTATTYHWQVRALPEGAWSAIATFYVDIQLDTLGPGAAPEAPPVDASGEAQAPEAGAGVDLRPAFHGFVWVATGSSFAGLLLAVFGRDRLRLRRPES